MTKIISVGLALYWVISVFGMIGSASTFPIGTLFTVGDAFKVLGVMVMWSIVTLMVYIDFKK